ncbi:hypothetical protein [Alteromonas sp. C1M14]|uniref:hypothetical protein n=1 Tax=Alteromonas sp. C1M14 TaxID=2841567 RepID=UPI001C09EF59|nr:hypothetical protein [Alteromonas sp. C1M14]MBU2978372.1 hypothetical protein [Alteromonas sp. C1M14]
MSQKRSKITLIGVFFVFVMPVLVAKLALDNGWFNSASTNKGELLQPVRDLGAVFAQEAPKWRIVYFVPEQCDSACENAIYSIRQVWVALGRENDRAQATVLVTHRSDPSMVKQLRQDNRFHMVNVASTNVHQVLEPNDTKAILLVDTLNNAMLRYPIFADKQAAVQSSRNILADVKKLLKLSRIG